MNASRQRKIVYMLCIVGLFSVLIGVSRWLEASADRHQLSQRSLGKVDPISGTAQLVMLGMRGVAVTFLWAEAIELKKKERYFEVRPVVESITLLQPHFVSAWNFQAWTIGYNIAAAWESIPDQYHWIKEGISYAKGAVEVNRGVSDLEWYVGFMYYHRIGKHDHQKDMRQMFRDDPDLSYSMSKSGIKDNYLVAFDWFVQGNKTVIDSRTGPRSKSVVAFMSMQPISKTTYAEYLNREGVFSEQAKNAWRDAHYEWVEQFGMGYGLGGLGRHVLIHRVEFSDEEYAALTEDHKYWADHYGKVVNYRFFRSQSQAEPTDLMQAARENMYKADQSRDRGDYDVALREYEASFEKFRDMLNLDDKQDPARKKRHASLYGYMRTDLSGMVEILLEYQDKYLRLLSRVGRPHPVRKPFTELNYYSVEE